MYRIILDMLSDNKSPQSKKEIIVVKVIKTHFVFNKKRSTTFINIQRLLYKSKCKMRKLEKNNNFDILQMMQKCL